MNKNKSIKNIASALNPILKAQRAGALRQTINFVWPYLNTFFMEIPRIVMKFKIVKSLTISVKLWNYRLLL